MKLQLYNIHKLKTWGPVEVCDSAHVGGWEVLQDACVYILNSQVTVHDPCQRETQPLSNESRPGRSLDFSPFSEGVTGPCAALQYHRHDECHLFWAQTTTLRCRRGTLFCRGRAMLPNIELLPPSCLLFIGLFLSLDALNMSTFFSPQIFIFSNFVLTVDLCRTTKWNYGGIESTFIWRCTTLTWLLSPLITTYDL